jgi:carbonic anhydrase
MKKHLLCASLSLVSLGLCTQVMARNDHASSWTYSAQTGPEHWGELQDDYKLCSTGKAQSPIDIGDAVKADLTPLAFSYRSSSATVLNNGHTIQVSPVDAGGITLSSGDYSLVQLHFHTPSEEKIQGRAYPLVAHFVHRNAAGELAVVAVLFEEGVENPALQSILSNMPKTTGDMVNLPLQNIADLLPATRHYYSYMGSLTTPPCSEGVRWHVLTQPVQLSAAQLQAFQALYPMNARPVQPLNGRTVHVGG